MRIICLYLAALFVAGWAVHADEVLIESFDPSGKVTFNEVTNATEYRVDWTTNLIAMVWSTSAPPGIAAIPATGSGSRTVTVGVEQAACFYRVQANVTNAGDAELYMVIDLSGGTGAMSYAVNYLAAVPPGGWTDEYKTTKLVLRRITHGEFTMGSPTNELGRDSDEIQHQVTLTKDYYIGVFEVTQKQWERVMGTWPSYFTNAAYRDTRPVDQVSYYDIRENPDNTPISPNWPQSSAVGSDSFMGKLRAKTGLTTLDLPTESQWERACRAGTTTALNSGYNLTNTASDAHMDEVGRYWYNGGSGGSSQGCEPSAGTALVGTYLANQWGLYDMHGNVWEWCLDWYGTYPGTVDDPPGADSESDRVSRGGSWEHYAGNCRSAFRFVDPPSSRFFIYGFRLSRTLQ